MKLIQKQNEPNYLTEHRKKDGTDYESFKRDVGLGNISPPTGLRESLLNEQGFLCAYCMKRVPHKHIEKGIERDDMKIEHRISQTTQESKVNKLDISYGNMFACCMGNEGLKEKFQTCDTKKSHQSITINPTNANHIRTISYAPDGSIHSTDVVFDKEIKEILNLNEDNLRRQRESIFYVISRKTRTDFQSLWSRAEKNAYLTNQIKWWNERFSDKFQELCMVAIYYLESRRK
jgi:uncharacterized protein (TIGR02646 family)